jgi:hypothetical protein
MSEVNELNVQTKKVFLREYTKEELKQRQFELSNIIEPEFSEIEIDSIKSSILNKLKNLGLTNEEAKKMVGM